MDGSCSCRGYGQSKQADLINRIRRMHAGATRIQESEASFMDNSNYARSMLGHNVIVVLGWLIRYLAVQVNNLQFVCDGQPSLSRSGTQPPVGTSR